MSGSTYYAIREDVDGAPVQPGAQVQIISRADETADPRWLGEFGVVEYLEYNCGCGQTYPTDPMVGVRFGCGKVEEFWKEELHVIKPCPRMD